MNLAAFLRANRVAFLLAVQFLTRLRIPVDHSPEALRNSPRWYPAVGVIVVWRWWMRGDRQKPAREISRAMCWKQS